MAIVREACLGLRLIERAALDLAELRETEVEHTDGAVGRHHHVVGFQIAMNDALLVRIDDRRDHAPGERHRLRDIGMLLRHALFGDACLEALARDELHRDERIAAVTADPERFDDPSVLEARRELRFANKSPASVLVFHERGAQQLERDFGARGEVDGAVDDPHPTFAEHALDPVAPDLGPHDSCPLLARGGGLRTRTSGHFP